MWVAAQSACSYYFLDTVKLIYVLDSPFDPLCGTFHPKSKNFSRFLVTSNPAAHA